MTVVTKRKAELGRKWVEHAREQNEKNNGNPLPHLESVGVRAWLSRLIEPGAGPKTLPHMEAVEDRAWLCLTRLIGPWAGLKALPHLEAVSMIC